MAILRHHYAGRAESFDLSTIGQMESATLIYDRNGEVFGKIFIQNRNPVPYSAIPDLMVKAVVASEDNRFYEHDGVDYWGIARAAIQNYRSGSIKSGASTVTQQLARNSFDLKERTYGRKLVEIFLAQRIEKQFKKDQIMEMYLNRVYFGSGFWGIDAAARGYFGVAPKDLSIGQCAALAGLLKNPYRRSPWNDPEASRAARNVVLEKMKDMRFITSAQCRQEQDGVLVTRRRTNPFKVSYAVDYVRQQAIAALGFDRAMNGGFRIYTTLDSKVQRAAEMSLRNKLSEIERAPGYRHETYERFAAKFKPWDETLRTGGFPQTPPPTPEYIQGAVLALENATGGILAMVGGREFKHNEYNRALQARRPAGTAFTPLVFAAAYEKGIFPGDIVQDAALDNRYVNIGGTTGILGEWGVERADNEYEGGIPAREALVKSKNAATVRLGWQTGMKAFQETARKAGIRSPLRNFSNAFLGTSEVTLDELTLAFTAFPGGGTRPTKPFIIQKITDDDGSTVYEAKAERVPVVSEAAAFQVHVGLEEALRRGTGAQARELGDIPAAGKTGTAYNFTDTYFVGYTSAVTCGVWVGFDKPTRIYRGAFGKDLALPVWADVIKATTNEFPAEALRKPPSLKEVSICRVSGLLETGKCRHESTDPTTGGKRTERTAYVEYATEAQMPDIPCDIHGTGLRSYAKELDQADWPRAASAIDLASIRPIAISEPALRDLNDVYRSVRPAAHRLNDEDIPVAKAIRVGEETGETTEDGVPVARAIEVAGPVPTGAQEVRRAEEVKPLDTAPGGAQLPLDTPEPIRF